MTWHGIKFNIQFNVQVIRYSNFIYTKMTLLGTSNIYGDLDFLRGAKSRLSSYYFRNGRLAQWIGNVGEY